MSNDDGAVVCLHKLFNNFKNFMHVMLRTKTHVPRYRKELNAQKRWSIWNGRCLVRVHCVDCVYLLSVMVPIAIALSLSVYKYILIRPIS